MMPRAAARLALLLAALALCSAQAGAIQAGDDWSLRVPSEDPVVYRGALSLDNAGSGPGGMLYPAPGVAGLIAAVITHAAIVDSVKTAEKSRLQEEADRVLISFREQLKDFRYPRLMKMALERVSGTGRKTLTAPQEPAAGWLFTSAPVFSLTQDRRALILDNTLALFAPGEASRTPAHTVTVRVVSRPRAELEPDQAWEAPAGEATALQEESAQLLAHSLMLALRDAGRTDRTAGAAKTVRYAEGGTSRVERAEPLETLCERRVLRTLRGWLLSVPVAAESATGSACAGDPGSWR